MASLRVSLAALGSFLAEKNWPSTREKAPAAQRRTHPVREGFGGQDLGVPGTGTRSLLPQGFTAAECHHLPSPLHHSHPTRHRHAAQPLLLGGQSRATHPKAPSGPHPWGHEGHTHPPSETLGDTGPKFSLFSKNPTPSTSRGRALPPLHMGLGPPHRPHPNPPAPEQQGQRCPGPRNCSASALLPGTLKPYFLHLQHPKTPTTLFPAPPCSPKTPIPMTLKVPFTPVTLKFPSSCTPRP